MQTGWDFRNNMMEVKEKNGITENFDDIVCVHNEFCGGCSFQNISYAEQLEIKENEILTLIDKKKLSVNLIEKIEPSPIKFRYRNKMEYTFGDLVKDGEMTLGMHKKGFHMSIVTVDQCQLVHEDYNKVLKAVLEFVREKGYRKYNKNYGFYSRCCCLHKFYNCNKTSKIINFIFNLNNTKRIFTLIYKV